LLNTIIKMGIPEIVDQTIPIHKNWTGLSPGYTMAVWLTHLLYNGDHTLSRIESWAEERINVLSAITGKPINSRDFSDDRLGNILEKLSDPEIWDTIETNLNDRIIRVYDLNSSVVRIDCTTVNSYAVVSKDGLIQFGISKDRADLPQIKIPLAILDPYGLPLVISTVKGNCADDPQYIPTMHKVRRSIQKTGLLYVGDCKMCAIAIRADTVRYGDFYLCPLSEVSYPISELDKNILKFSQNDGNLKPIVREYADGETREVALAFEETAEINCKIDDEVITWQERRIFTKSIAHAEVMVESLNKRITTCEEKLNKLNNHGRGHKPPKTFEEAVERANRIIEKSNLKGIVTCSVKVEEQVSSKENSTGKSSRKSITPRITVIPEVDKLVYEQKLRTVGWRVFVTNQSPEILPIEDVVLMYRNQFIIEDIFHRIKGKSISIQPLYLHRHDRIDGLVKFVSVAVRILICIETAVRDALKKTPEQVAGIYPYLPKKVVQNLRAEQILRAFKGITVTIVATGKDITVYCNKPSKLQSQLLRLLGFEQTMFDDITTKVGYLVRR